MGHMGGHMGVKFVEHQKVKVDVRFKICCNRAELATNEVSNIFRIFSGTKNVSEVILAW